MSKPTLFQIAAVYYPRTSKETTDNGNPAKPVIIVQPETILAADVGTATLIAGRKIPESYVDRLDQVEVAVTPF